MTERETDEVKSTLGVILLKFILHIENMHISWVDATIQGKKDFTIFYTWIFTVSIVDSFLDLGIRQRNPE